MKFKSGKILKYSIYSLVIIIFLWLSASAVLFSISGSIIYKNKLATNYECKSECKTEYIKNSSDNEIEMIWFASNNANSKDTYIYLFGNAGRLDFIIDGLISFGNVLSPAYPSYYSSKGKASTDSVNETIDLAIKHLRDKKIKDENIILLGHSLGGAPAVYASTRYPNLNKVILVNTFYSIQKMCEIEYGPLCIFSNSIHNSAKIASFAKAKIRQFHNPNDNLIPISQGKDLFNLLGSIDKKFFEISGTHSKFDVAFTLNK